MAISRPMALNANVSLSIASFAAAAFSALNVSSVCPRSSASLRRARKPSTPFSNAGRMSIPERPSSFMDRAVLSAAGPSLLIAPPMASNAASGLISRSAAAFSPRPAIARAASFDPFAASETARCENFTAFDIVSLSAVSRAALPM